MKNIELLKEQSESENMESRPNSTSENSELENNNQPIGYTPLVSRLNSEKWFATVGKYKVSPEFEVYDELTAWVNETTPTWEHVGAIIGAQFDYFQAKIEAIQEEIKNLNNN